MKKQKAFSLVELVVVIVIIGILASIGVVSYNGAQRNSRDNKRKVDLQSIGLAYQVHYQDTKSWNFTSAELAKISTSGATTEANNGVGNGAINYQGLDFKVSAMNALVGLKYLSQPLRDPLISSDDSTTQIVGTFTASQYFKYPCIKTGSTKPDGIFLLAKMEGSSYDITTDTNPELDSCTSPLGSDFVSIRNYAVNNGLNYAIKINQ